MKNFQELQDFYGVKPNCKYRIILCTDKTCQLKDRIFTCENDQIVIEDELFGIKRYPMNILNYCEYSRDKNSILNDDEIMYLNGVIAPFRQDVVFIYKKISKDKHREQIVIITNDCTMYLHMFPKGEYYKGMLPMFMYRKEELLL